MKENKTMAKFMKNKKYKKKPMAIRRGYRSMTKIQTQCMVQGVSYNNLLKQYLIKPKEMMKSIKEFGKRLYNLLMPIFKELYEKLTSYGYYSNR